MLFTVKFSWHFNVEKGLKSYELFLDKLYRMRYNYLR